MAGLVTMDSCPTNNTPALDQPPQTAPSRRSLSAHEHLYRLAASFSHPPAMRPDRALAVMEAAGENTGRIKELIKDLDWL